MLNLTTLAQNLATAISSSRDQKISASQTETLTKVKNQVVAESIKENLAIGDISNLTTDSEFDTKISSHFSRLWSGFNISDLTKGYFYTKKINNDDSYALLWNEPDGGGSQYYNKTANILSYVGTNDGGSDGICVQIYSKYKDTTENQTQNNGVRINVNPNGAYYTKGIDTTATGGSVANEIAVKGDVNTLLNRISELESLVTTLQTALSNAVDVNGNSVYTMP